MLHLQSLVTMLSEVAREACSKRHQQHVPEHQTAKLPRPEKFQEFKLPQVSSVCALIHGRCQITLCT